MKNWDFEVGKYVEVPRQVGKPEWPDAVRIVIPNRRQAWRMARQLLAQLENEEDCSGVVVTLHGEMTKEHSR